MNTAFVRLLAWYMFAQSSIAHPLGDRTFDRAIQVVILPDRIAIDYRLGLSELTLTQELLTLADQGSVPVNATVATNLYKEIIAPILHPKALFRLYRSSKASQAMLTHQNKMKRRAKRLNVKPWQRSHPTRLV